MSQFKTHTRLELVQASAYRLEGRRRGKPFLPRAWRMEFVDEGNPCPTSYDTEENHIILPQQGPGGQGGFSTRVHILVLLLARASAAGKGPWSACW